MKRISEEEENNNPFAAVVMVLIGALFAIFIIGILESPERREDEVTRSTSQSKPPEEQINPNTLELSHLLEQIQTLEEKLNEAVCAVRSIARTQRGRERLPRLLDELEPSWEGCMILFEKEKKERTK